MGQQPQQAPDGGPVHYERHRPEQTTLYRLVQQQHAATFFAQAEAETGGAVTLIQRFGSPCKPRLANGQAPRQAQTVQWTVCVRA